MPLSSTKALWASQLKSENPREVRAATDGIFQGALGVYPDDIADGIIGLLETSSLKQPSLATKKLAEKLNEIIGEFDGDMLQKMGHGLHVKGLLTTVGHSRALQNQFSTAKVSARTPGGAVDGARSKSAEGLSAVLDAEQVFVLTSHPTETKPPEMMQRYNKMIVALETGQGEVEAVSALLNASQNLDRKKTPAEELEEVIPPIINLLKASARNTREISEALEGPIGQQVPNAFAKPFYSASTWIGGDRDGNPNVTTDFAITCADRYKQEAINLIANELTTAKDIVTNNQDAAEEIQGLIDKIKNAGYEYPEKLIEDIWKTRASYHLSEACRIQLKSAAIITTHAGFHFAKIQHRQDSGVIQMIFAEMMQGWQNSYGISYENLTDEDKAKAVEGIIADPEMLKQRFANTKTRLKDSEEKDDKVAYDLMLLMEAIPDRPNAWDSFVMANAGFTADGKSITHGRDVMEMIAIMNATGADRICKVIPLFESLESLKSAGDTVRALLGSKSFRSHIAQHQFAMCIMIALSDTTRQHGPGIIAYQEQAIVDVALAILDHNKTVPEKERVSLETFFGGALDGMRGGGDPTTRYFTLARKVMAAAREAGHSSEAIAHLVGRRQLQTRQGRDVTSRLFNTVKNATVHVSEMLAGILNFRSFMHKPRNKKGERVLEACKKELKSDEAFRAQVADPAIARYETGFRGIFDYVADFLVPWELVAGITIANRGISRDMKDKPKETQARAITMQNAEHLIGHDKASWFGLRSMANLSPEARRELLENSRGMQTMLVKSLQGMAGFDFESAWVLAGIEKPNLLDKADAAFWNEKIAEFDCHFDQAVKKGDKSWRAENSLEAILGPDATQQDKQTLILLWLEEDYRATLQVVGETLLGDSYARHISASDLIKRLGPRLSYEIEDTQKTTKLARLGMAKIWAKAKTEDGKSDPSLGQAALTWARAVFDGCQSPVSGFMPGYKPDQEKLLHQCISDLAKKGGAALFNLRKSWLAPAGLQA